MSNVTVSFTPANVTVDETNLSVNVSQTTSNIVVSAVATIGNAQVIRDQLSVTDTGGDGSLTYSNTTGVFTYTGPSASEVRAHFSNTSPITLSSGVIGIDSNALFSAKTTDDLPEGSTNLYYTNARFNTDFATRTTDDLSQGATNLYFTTALANTAIGNYTGSLENLTGNITTTANVSGNFLLGSNLNTTGSANIDENLTARRIYADLSVEAVQNVRANLDLEAGRAIRLGSNANVKSILYRTADDVNQAYINYDALGDEIKFNFASIPSGLGNVLTASGNGNVVTVHNLVAANVITADTIEPSGNTVTINGEGSITGNLVVGGNIDYTHVNDLYVANNEIVMNANSASDVNVSITVNRPVAGANAFLRWDETADQWLINDGSASYVIPKSTSDLAEGTNLYYTNARANAAFVDSLDDITTAISSTANITTTANISGANVIGTYLYGDASNITNLDDFTSNITTTANITGGYIIAGNDAGGDGIFIGDINGAVQQEVKNETGAQLDRGKAVYLTGTATGATPHVALANNSNASLMPVIGIVKNNIPDTETGEIVTSGQLNIGTHGFAQGSDLFVNGTGDLQVTAPTGEGNLVQKIGKVVSNTHIIVQGAFRTNATPNLDEGNIFLGSSSNTAIGVTPDSNFDTTGNVFSLSNTLTDVNSIASETGANLNLKGQADGIHFDTTIDSTESRIVDLDTTGYSIADVTTPADFTQGTNTPSVLVSLNTTAGSPTATINNLGFGVIWALRGPTFGVSMSGSNLANVMTGIGINYGLGANGINNPAAGLYGQDKGWGVFDLTTTSIATLFPANAYVTGISTNTITMSENALVTGTNSVVLTPGMAQTSDSKTTVKYYANTHTGSNSEFISNYGRLSNFDLPETLSNTTFDAISYGNTTSVTTTVTMKNISDFAGTDESATRFKRGLLIGAATTPDPASGRSTLNQPSTLGVILESDGESFNDGLNTPAPRFLINNYSGGLDDLTSYPVWAQVGATGNLTLDLPQIKAPSLTLKSFRGAKSTANTTSYLMQAGDVVGKIAFSPAQTTGTGNQGVDAVNPPAAITVDVGSANINTGVANAYMHITTTPYPGTNLGYLRNNANTDSGANQQTNLTTKDGNLTLAAQTSGMISLAPTPDYGDAANSTVWTRYPGTTHEYHRFMDVGFLDKTNKNGTLVTIQPASGTTTGSGGLGYDSKGNATLRFQTHLANSDAKYNFDINHDQANENLIIQSNNGGTEHISVNSGGKVSIKQVMNLNPLSNSAILALGGNSAGDVVYGSDVNKVCYYNGSSWKTIDDNTDIV